MLPRMSESTPPPPPPLADEECPFADGVADVVFVFPLGLFRFLGGDTGVAVLFIIAPRSIVR